MTKIDSNYFEISLKNYNIVDLIKSITISVSVYAQKKNIDLHFCTNIKEKIMAIDPDQIERIILNLLSNAIKFTEEGGDIWVTILDRVDSIEIIIKDTGIGIPLERQEIIFDRFQQADNSTTRNFQGSGIGLSLVKALVEKHNGRIILHSEIGIGSEFIIELPTNIIEEDCSSLETENFSINDHVESINIEFSDIYS